MAQVRTQLGEVRGEQPPPAFYPGPGQALPAELPGDAAGSAA